MLISDEGVLFLLGIGGVGIRSVSATWKSSNLPKLMYAFIYRLYRPEHFVDPSYVNVTPDVPKNSVKYTVRIAPPQTNTINCPGFFPLFASSLFGTRTHVLTNLLSKVQVNNRDVTVLKDQLCRPDTRFNEQSILIHIHQPVKVPGVVETVHSETIKAHLSEGRQKHRLGLQQSGSPFMSIRAFQPYGNCWRRCSMSWRCCSIETLLAGFTMLMSLQVLLYLRFERKILHQDISEGNILYIPQPISVAPGASPTLIIAYLRPLLCHLVSTLYSLECA